MYLQGQIKFLVFEAVQQSKGIFVQAALGSLPQGGIQNNIYLAQTKMV